MGNMITGGCRSGQLRYQFEHRGPLANYCCHCLDCQKTTGSAFADQIVVAADGLTVEGRRTESTIARPSGGITTHLVCPDCHGRISSANTVFTDIALVRGGTLDDPSLLDPFLHMWVSRKRAWMGIAEDVPTFAENPPPGEFMRLAADRRSG